MVGEIIPECWATSSGISIPTVEPTDFALSAEGTLPGPMQTSLASMRFSTTGWPCWESLSEGDRAMWLSGRQMEGWRLDDAAAAGRVAERTML